MRDIQQFQAGAQVSWPKRQQAAVAVWKSLSVGHNDANASAVSRNAAIEWQRQWRGIKSFRTGAPAPPTFYAKGIHDESEARSERVDDNGCIVGDVVVEELFEMLLNTRRAKGQKEIDGAMRAASIMRLIVAGQNNFGICHWCKSSAPAARRWTSLVRGPISYHRSPCRQVILHVASRVRGRR